MDLAKLLERKNISQYRLSKMSNVPQATISDICSNKTSIDKCSAMTLFKLTSSLHVSVEDFLTKELDDISVNEYETFKSNLCHEYKNSNPKEFIDRIVRSKEIERLFKNKEFAKSFYLIAIVDYACDKNHISRIKELDLYRGMSLLDPIYPESIVVLDQVMNTNANKKEAYKKCLPQFKRFNIIESDIENVY